MNNNRKKWIDVAKGIGIICVQIGHSYFPEEMWMLVNSFHMPLFFVLSGITFNGGKYSLKEYVLRKTKTLFIPYLLFNIITSIINCAFIFIKTQDFKFDFDYLGVFFGYNNRPLWFLMCLFLTEILFYFVYSYVRDKRLRNGIIIIIVLMAIINNYILKIKFYPMCLDILPNSLLYFMLGYYFRNRWKSIISCQKKVALIIVCLAINSASAFVNVKSWGHTISMMTSEYGWYFVGMAGAISGIIIVVYISQVLEVKHNIFSRGLSFIGYNSLLYYALLQPLATPIADRVLKIILPFYKSGYIGTIVTAVILMIVAFVIIAIVTVPYNKLVRRVLYK